MSKSAHQIAIKAVDQTKGSFDSIRKNALVTGNQIRNILGGALAFSGAYLGLKGIMNGINELGKLSDVAQKAGISVDELTRAATAFNVLGVQNMGVDEIGKAFSMLAKNTGRTGLGGFYQAVEELGKIDDVSKRGEAAMKVFGRSGLEFMPLINAAKDGTNALRDVIGVMPGVTQAAANVGDAMADAKTIGASAFHSIWLRAIGAVCGLFNVDVRGAAVSMGAYVEYAAATSWRYMKAFFTANESGCYRFKLSWNAICNEIVRSVVIMSATCYEYIKTIPERFIAGVGGGIMGTFGIFSKRYRDWHNDIMSNWMKDISQGMWSKIDQDLKELGVSLKSSIGQDFKDIFSDVNTKDLRDRLEEVISKAKTFKDVYNGAAMSSATRKLIDIDSGVSSSTKPAVRNDLILGGSNAATRLAILGPTLQTEQRKTNALLGTIVEKLNDVTGNQDEMISQSDGVGVID